MPRNPTTGVYTAPASSVNPAQTRTRISSTDFNGLVDDFEAALNGVVLAGQPQSLADEQQDQALANVARGDVDWTGLHSFAVGPKIKPNNIGGKTRDQLETMFGLNNTGNSAFAWNYSGGGGELNLIINRNSGTQGGFSILEFPNTSGDPVTLFRVRGTPNSGFGKVEIGTALSSPAPSFGGKLHVATNVTGGAGNCIVGAVLQDSPINTLNFPTGVTGYGRQDPASTGNQVFGIFGRADLNANGVATNELNTFNFAGAPNTTFPHSQAIGIPDYVPVTLQLGAGGAYPSKIALQICKEGSEPQTYITGIYMRPDAVTDWGLYIDAGTAAGSRGPSVGAFIKNYGDGTHLKLQTTGAMQASNTVIQALTAGGAGVFSVQQNGRINTIHSLTVGATTFNTGSILMSGVTSGTVTIKTQDAAGTYTLNLPTTAGNSGDVLTSGGGGSAAMTWTGATGTGSFVKAASPTITGTLTAATANFSGNVTLVSTLPNFSWHDSDGAVDAKIWSAFANANQLTFRTVNDAQNAVTPFLVVTRSGNTISSIATQGGDFVVRSDTATTAGGSTGARLLFGTTSGFGIYYGSGLPTVSAAQGSIYLRSDGSSTSTRMYVNNSSVSGTTWTNLVTAA